MTKVPWVLSLILAASYALTPTLDSNEYSKAIKDLVKNNNLVSNELYQILKETVPGNLVFSPFSLRTVLAMLQAGARGSTKDEIELAMKFPKKEDDLFNGYLNLLDQIKRKSNVTVEIANKIYLQNGFDIQDNFKILQKSYFHSPFVQLDFNKPKKAAEEINNWVATNTGQRIQKLIEPSVLNNQTKLVLVNTLYFKGSWENKFYNRATQKKPFFLDETQEVKVDMMNTEDYFRVANVDTLDAKVLILPYEISDRKDQNNVFQMVLLIPNKRTGLKYLEEKLKQHSLSEIVDFVPNKSKNIVLNLPKFEVESYFELTEPMKKMGLSLMFDENKANLTGIPSLSERLSVSKLIQKAFLSVDENGSEAGAATYAVVFTPLSIGPLIEEEITVDRPFVGFIHDAKTDTILFSFRITNV